MEQDGMGLRHYRGPKNACDWCQETFVSGDMIAVVPLGFIFCAPKFGQERDCIDRWRFEHRLDLVDFEVREFKGKDEIGGVIF